MSLKYYAFIAGGRGDNQRDREEIVEAPNIRSALEQVESSLNYNEVVVEIKQFEDEDEINRERQIKSDMQYAGCIGLLCEISPYVDGVLREQIDRAVSDWCALTTSWKHRWVLNRCEVYPVSQDNK